MMKARHYAKIFASLVFALAFSAHAKDAPLIACSLPLPPHTMPDEQGRPSGYVTSVLQGVARQLHWNIEIRYMPWLRVVDESKNGQCDIVYTVLKRVDYEEFLVFPKVAVQDRRNVIVVLRGKGVQYNGNLETFMRKHSIGLYRDKAVSPEFNRLRSADWVRLDESVDAHQNAQKLLAGRFDAAIENEMTMLYELGKLGRVKEVEILEPALDETQAYIAFPKSGRLVAHVRDFEAALLKFKQSPAQARLDKQYFKQH